jgi:hypothetical protein
MKHIALIFRHGDRSPTFNAMEPLALESALEAASWTLSLPTRQFSQELDRRFPIETHHTETRDEASLGRTFGSLTGLGVLQMRRLGQWVSARSSFPIQPKRVLASNFRRTQFSAQCLLAGLTKENVPVIVAKDAQDTLNVWGTDPILRRLLKSNGAIGVDIAKTTPEEENARNLFMRAVPSFGFLIRPFSWVSALDHFMCREGKMGGGGPLRGRSAPMRITEIFQEMDFSHSGKLDQEALRLALDKVLQSPFSGTAAGKDELDKLVKLIDKDGNGQVDFREMKKFLETLKLPAPCGGVTIEEFDNASKVIEKAVCRRFDAILSQPSIRRISAGSMAKNILLGLDEAIKARKDNPNVPPESTTLDLYSAHDVSITPLLKHLGIWDGMKDSWPGVAAALAFEITADADGSHPQVSVLYWGGVRGSLSGLEPRVLGLEPVAVKLNFGDDADKVVDLEKLRSWAIRL